MTTLSTDPAGPPWYRDITPQQWHVLVAAKLGWMLDAMDVMFYSMAVGHVRESLGLDDAMAGLVATVTLAMSAMGGLLFGLIADRFGRKRALIGTILTFSLASLGAATSQTVFQLMIWRGLLGMGMGGEWVVGVVLVSETWPPAHRNKAIGIVLSGWALGYTLAALFAASLLDLPALGADSWRVLFAIGVLPAGLALFVRRNLREPAVWLERRRTVGRHRTFTRILGRDLLPSTVVVALLSSTIQFAYWGTFFWLPAYLARPIEEGGAGMGVVRSLRWIIPLQLGAYVGYLTFGFIADAIGRRRAFVLFMLSAAVMVIIYGQMARHPTVLMILGPALGYFGHGYFAMFGSLVAELFPTEVRATGQGASYNAGRLIGGLAPFVIGTIAMQPGMGIGLAIATTSAFFAVSAALVLFLPDRGGQALP